MFQLGEAETAFRVHAAGVNFADSLMVGGTYQVRPPFPFTPGLPRRSRRRCEEPRAPLPDPQAIDRNAGLDSPAASEIGARRRRGGADPRCDGFRHRRRLSGCLRAFVPGNAYTRTMGRAARGLVVRRGKFGWLAARQPTFAGA
jgi:hypothetical protein